MSLSQKKEVLKLTYSVTPAAHNPGWLFTLHFGTEWAVISPSSSFPSVENSAFSLLLYQDVQCLSSEVVKEAKGQSSLLSHKVGQT